MCFDLDTSRLFPAPVQDFLPAGLTDRQNGYDRLGPLVDQTVEPVFGQIKECRGFRRFLHRGFEKVHAEWTMICTAHNLLKLAAAGAR